MGIQLQFCTKFLRDTFIREAKTMKIFSLLVFYCANAGEIVKGNDGRVVSRISKYGTFRKNVGKKVQAEVEPTVDYMAMHNPGLAEELAKIMDSANANDAEYVAKKNAKMGKKKPPRQLLGSAPKTTPKRGPPKRPSVSLKSAAGGMSDQERRRQEQRIRDEFEKSKSDREFQKVKDYAVKGAMGIGVVVVLLGVMIFIRNKLEERAKATKLAEERAAAAEKAKPAQKTPADLKALEDEEVAKKAEERENEKIYDTIDSEDQKKIDELYEKKPISS